VDQLIILPRGRSATAWPHFIFFLPARNKIVEWISIMLLRAYKLPVLVFRAPRNSSMLSCQISMSRTSICLVHLSLPPAVRVLLTVKLKAMNYYKYKEHLCSYLLLCRLPFSKVSRHYCLRFRSECSTFHFQEEEFRVFT